MKGMFPLEPCFAFLKKSRVYLKNREILKMICIVYYYTYVFINKYTLPIYLNTDLCLLPVIILQKENHYPAISRKIMTNMWRKAKKY